MKFIEGPKKRNKGKIAEKTIYSGEGELAKKLPLNIVSQKDPKNNFTYSFAKKFHK